MPVRSLSADLAGCWRALPTESHVSIEERCVRATKVPPMMHAMATEVIAEASGRRHREDPVLGGTGGPAGNARLTAWTGLVLLVLFVAELVTLLDVRGLISWHLVIGALLVPPALLKTATTGWRIARYYTGHRPYRDAGPPPLFLRVLGPLVVLFTLAVLASGLTLIVIGPDGSRRTLLDMLGQRVDAVTVHQATFVIWAVVTGVHTLARIIPALRLTLPRGSATPGVPGRYRRGAALIVVLAVAVLTGGVVLSAAGTWRSQPDRPDGPPGRHAGR
jgi:hypothetical protein